MTIKRGKRPTLVHLTIDCSKKSEDKSLLTMRLSEILPLSATMPTFPSVVEESVISPISVNLQVHNPLEIPLTRIMPSVQWMGQL